MEQQQQQTPRPPPSHAFKHSYVPPAGLNPAVEQSSVGISHHYHDDDNAAVAERSADATGQDAGGTGSSLLSAIFNFSNCIVGAGAIGLGGAIADSGGIISILAVLFFAFLTKLSLDLVILLSIRHAPSVQSTQEQDSQQQQAQQQQQQPLSYEQLGRLGFGRWGMLVVMACKFLYSAGCLVAYIVVIKDNFASALLSLLWYPEPSDNTSSPEFIQEEAALMMSLFSWKKDDWSWSSLQKWLLPWDNVADNDGNFFHILLQHDVYVTWIVSAGIIFPLCLLRDMTPLATLSAVSIAAMVSICFIVIYLYIANPMNEIRHDDHSSNNNSNDDMLYDHWFEIRPAFLECLGTFLFTFVSQHTVHLAYTSLQPRLQTYQNWKTVSTYSISIATAISLAVGVVVYISFWEQTKSDIFEIYPDNLPLLDLAKLLLSWTMVFTFPLPFFTCRELLIVFCFPPDAVSSEADESNSSDLSDDSENDDGQEQHDHHQCQQHQPLSSTTAAPDSRDGGCTSDDVLLAAPSSIATNGDDCNDDDINNDLEQPLLRMAVSNGTLGTDDSMAAQSSVMSIRSIRSVAEQAFDYVHSAVLLPGQDRQLKLLYHVIVTFKLWLVVTGLAIAAPNLGDVLDLVGCATGTLIAFVLPALLAWKLDGYSHTAAIILLVGGVVGIVGTFYSTRQLFRDIHI